MGRQSALLWFAVFGGITAWTMHLILSYAAVGLSCPLSSDRTPELSGLVTVALVLISIVMLAVAALASGVARAIAARTSGWKRFMALFGLLLNLLSVVAILFAAVVPAALRPCS